MLRGVVNRCCTTLQSPGWSLEAPLVAEAHASSAWRQAGCDYAHKILVGPEGSLHRTVVEAHTQFTPKHLLQLGAAAWHSYMRGSQSIALIVPLTFKCSGRHLKEHAPRAFRVFSAKSMAPLSQWLRSRPSGARFAHWLRFAHRLCLENTPGSRQGQSILSQS